MFTTLYITVSILQGLIFSILYCGFTKEDDIESIGMNFILITAFWPLLYFLALIGGISMGLIYMFGFLIKWLISLGKK